MNNSLTNFAEQWVQHYKSTNSPVSYRAFDYESIKRSLVEYLQIYHPEYFNNLIETDELLPILEMFAYVGDLYSYRADMNTQEHILANATRKSSVLQLASMLGYTASRRVAATGLVKITSISTTEQLKDSTGYALKNKVVRWNDALNPNWQSHFTRIVNRIMNNQSGIASERDKISVGGVVVERYAMNTTPFKDGVYKFSINLNGETYPMELVPAELQPNGIVEERPIGDRPPTLLFLNDGMGTSSDSTGYFLMVKQGTLSKELIDFAGTVPNRTHKLTAVGISDSDVFLNKLDNLGRVTELWDQVGNVSYNDSIAPTVYQVETLEDDGIRLIFGDGTYATMPQGSFECWVRQSADSDVSIPASSIVNQKMSVEYRDDLGNQQTATLEFSLMSPIVTGSSGETVDKIKQSAPGVFSTQDRMVNARDHQSFLLQDATIIKAKAVNRTFAGHTKYRGWYDGSETYDNVKIFGNDGVIYIHNDRQLVSVPNPNFAVSTPALIDQHIEPLLDRPDLWLHIAQKIRTNPTVRKFFTVSEKQNIQDRVEMLVIGGWVGLNWDEQSLTWIIESNSLTENDNDIEIKLPTDTTGWLVQARVARTVFMSPSTKFWDYGLSTTQDYDTLNPTTDLVTILQANTNKTRTGVLDSAVLYRVANNFIPFEQLPNQALVDYSRVEVVGNDVDGDLFPEDLSSDQILGKKFQFLSVSSSGVVTLPVSIISLTDIIQVQNYSNNQNVNYELYTTETTSPAVWYQIKITTPNVTSVTVTIADFVYFETSDGGEKILTLETDAIKTKIANGVATVSRNVGRRDLNFLWQHFSDQFELVDPAKTNINDVFVVTKQFYSALTQWLRDSDYTKPVPPMPSYADLQVAYGKYLQKGMMSDEIVLRPARFKILFGPRSKAELRAKIQLVVRGTSVSNLTVKNEVVRLVREYFDISNQDFGQTFFFSDLSRYISTNSKYALGSVLLVPLFPNYQFGDLYQLKIAPDELIAVDFGVADVEIVENITDANLRQ